MADPLPVKSVEVQVNISEVAEEPPPPAPPQKISVATDTGEDSRSSILTSSTESNPDFRDFQSQTDLCPQSPKTCKRKKKDKDLSSEEDEEEESESKSRKETEYTGLKRYAGMLCTLCASLCFSLAVLTVKVLTDYGFDAYGSSFWRHVGITIPSIPILIFCEWCQCSKANNEKRENEEKFSVFDTVWPVFQNSNWKTWIGLFSRALVGSTSVILRYYALQYLSIGDTAVITYSTPVLVTIMAHFFLGEKCGIVPICVTFTTLLGVIIVTRPPMFTQQESFDTDTLIGISLACGSLLCSSIIVIIQRKIREVHFSLMLLVYGIIGVAQALIMSLTLSNGTLNVPSDLNDSLLTAGLAVLSFLAQMASIMGLKFEQAGPVALIRSCDVIFGFLLQFIFLGVIPDLFSSLGAVIVLSGVLVIAIRKWLKSLPEDNNTRKNWSFLLR